MGRQVPSFTNDSARTSSYLATAASRSLERWMGMTMDWQIL